MASTHAAEAIRADQASLLANRASREQPLIGPSDIFGGCIRHALQVGDLNEARALLDTAEGIDRSSAQAEVLEVVRQARERLIEGGMELTDDQMTALVTVGIDLYLAGLYDGRKQGARSVNEIMQLAGGN